MIKNTSTTSALVFAAAISTAVLVILGVALIIFDRLSMTRDRSIEQIPQPPLTITIVCVLLLVLAVGWVFWLMHNRRRHIFTLIAAGIAALLLIITPLVAWQAFSSDRDLTIRTMTCDAESLRHTGGNPLDGCTEKAVDTIVLLEGINGRDQWVPDVTIGNVTREFRDLPGGSWQTRIIVDGPEDTTAVSVFAEESEKQVRVGSLRPYPDAESGRLRWSGEIPVDADVSNLSVLFFLSPNPVVPGAKIRLDVRACDGQSVRTFDASQCTPMDASRPFIYEKSPDGARTWRQVHVNRDGTALVVSNLEERTYTLQPDYANIEMETQNTDVLIIPAAMDQVSENSITEPGQSSFEIEIGPNTGELTYIMYVFPNGPTYAYAP